MRPSRPVLVLVAGAAALTVALPLAGSALAGRAPLDAADGGLHAYVGSLHEHSSYSDGYVPTTPATFYASGKRFGLDFMGGSDHSDFLGAPLSTSGYCAPDPGNPTAVDPVTQVQQTAQCPEVGTDGLRKWEATKEQARAATTKDYTAFQGFEWTSDVYGHINVYFSTRDANAKTTEPTPKALYDWLTRPPALGGGSDGVFTFNHPGAKDQLKPVRQAAGLPDEVSRNWNDFAYDPRVDQQAVGLEVYNDVQEYGTTRDTDSYPEGYYAHVLDKGWHVAPVGAEDLGHRRTDDWGGPSWAKTVLLATDRSPAALKAAMLARRMYAVRYGDVRLGLTVDGNLMGSRLTRAPGAPLHVAASATRPGHPGLSLELVTTHGVVVARGTDSLSTVLRAASGSSYLFLRVRDGAAIVGYSAPVWVSSR